MGEEIALENGRISDFHGLVTLTLTPNRVILYTFIASLVDFYLHTKFHWKRRNFLWTNGRTYGHLRPTNVIRSTRGSRPKNGVTCSFECRHRRQLMSLDLTSWRTHSPTHHVHRLPHNLPFVTSLSASCASPEDFSMANDMVIWYTAARWLAQSPTSRLENSHSCQPLKFMNGHSL